MKPTEPAETLFLICVFGFAAVFSVMSLSHTAAVLPGGHGAEATRVGSAGQSRDVDMEALQRLLDAGYLSDHEAEFYEPAPPAP